MKILISSLQVTQGGSRGHLRPAIELALALTRRGHEVFILPLPSALSDDDKQLLRSHQLTWIDPPALPTGVLKSRHELAQLAAELATTSQAYYSFLVAPLDYQFEGVQRLIKTVSPDVIVYDLLVYAAPLAARSLGIPDIGYCAGLKLIAPDSLTTIYQKIHRDIHPAIEAFLQKQSLQAVFHHLELLSSTHQLVFVPDRFIHHTHEPYPAGTALVGALPVCATSQSTIPEALLRHDQPIIVCFGSALDPADYTMMMPIIISVAKHYQKHLIISSHQPNCFSSDDHITVAHNLPLVELLPSASMLIHHGGANTFSEALTLGVPQLLIPLTTDQPIQASLLQHSQCGITLARDEITKDNVAHAFDILLDKQHPIHQKIHAAKCLYQSSQGDVAASELIEAVACHNHDKITLPTHEQIRQAYQLLLNKKISSPLMLLSDNLYIKLEGNLPGGSYKIRGVDYAVSTSPYTGTVTVPSAGNLALALAQRLKEDNRLCQALVPQGISLIKRQGLEKFGARIDEMDFKALWELVNQFDSVQSDDFLHPFNTHLLAGYASIILELKESGLHEMTLVIPYGLGGLAVALAHAIEVFNLNMKLVLCEITGAAPFTRARQAGHGVPGEKLKSFIEAMGTPNVIPRVFDYLKSRISDVIEVTESDVIEAIDSLYHSHGIRIEGAAGASLAAAKKIQSDSPVVALLTGSNLSDDVLKRSHCEERFVRQSNPDNDHNK